MNNPNPSLNDILKPILESKGWVELGRTLMVGTANIAGRPFQYPVYTDTFEYMKRDTKRIYVAENSVIRRNKKQERTLLASDPDFFTKLEVWLNG